MIARKQSELVGLRVRFREPLRKKLEVAAAKRGVSLNTELVDRLERSFSAEAVEQVVSSKLDRALDSIWTALAEGARQGKQAAAAYKRQKAFIDAKADPALQKRREETIKHAEKYAEERRKEFEADIERVRQRFEKEMQAKYGPPKEDKS
jgi:hypothetical protein